MSDVFARRNPFAETSQVPFVPAWPAAEPSPPPQRLLLVPVTSAEYPAVRVSAAQIACYRLTPDTQTGEATLEVTLASGKTLTAPLGPLDGETCGYLLTVLDDWFGGTPLPDGKPQSNLLDLADLAAYVCEPGNIDAAKAIADEMMRALLGATLPSEYDDAGSFTANGANGGHDR